MRRALMGAAVLLTGDFDPPRDQLLLTLKSHFDRTHDLIEAADMDDEGPFCALCREADRLAARIAELPIATAAGAHAKLDVVAREFRGGDAGGVNERLFRSALEWLRGAASP